MKKSIFLFFAAILCAIGMNAATQRYVYVGLSNNYHKWKNDSQWGINHWGGTGGGVVSGSKITDLETTFTHSGCTFHMYRMYVYDDNKNFEFKGNDSWWDCKKENISISGTTKNALLFRDDADGGSPTFYQTNYQEESAVSLSASSNSVSVGEEVALTPTLTSNAEYNEVKSTTYSVGAGATVSEGKFVATAAGTYTVTATITYNPKKFTGITKTVENVTCEIVVSEVAIPHPVTGVTVAPTSVTIKQGATTTLTATVAPSNADDSSVTWSSDNESVATVVNGVVTAVAAGTANITVTTVDGSFTATCAVKVKPLQYTFYAINSAEWPTVAAHYWGGADGGSEWPGADMVKESETINGFDIYSITISSDFINIMFTNQLNGDDKNKKTADLTTEGNDGKYYIHDYNGNTGWYTKAEAEELLATPLADETVYFVNNKEWASVAIYGWGGTASTSEGIGKWAGADMTKTAEQVAGFDVYSYTAKEGTVKNILFNYNADENKTSDFVWTNGKYYYMDEGAQKDKNYAGGTKEEVTEIVTIPVVTYDYYVIGTINSWGLKDAAYGMTDENADGVYEKEVALAIGKHELKINNGTWEDNTNIFGYDNLSVAYEGVSRGSGDGDNNIVIDLAEAKTVTVKFDKNTKKITFEGLTINTTSLTYRVEVPEGTEKCFIAGPCGVWAFQEMTREGETDIFTITIVGAKETDEYKYACQADWAYAEVIDGGGNRTAWTELDEVTAWGKPVVYTYYLMGVNDDWATGIEMEVNTGAENEVMLMWQPVNGEVKIKRLGDDESEYWYGGKSLKEEAGNLGTNTEAATDGDGNILLEEGIYNFYFNTADGKLWIEAATPDYTRDVTSGDYGTICLPNGGQLVGASAFSVLKKEGTTIILYEVGTTMVAGTPYVVFPNTGATKLYVFYTDNEDAPAGDANGLYGSYERRELDANVGNYIMLPGNKYAEVTGDRVFVAANRAYFKVDDIDDISTTALAPAPGVRRIAIGQAPQVATSMENIDASAQPVKTIINGQLFILRGEKMYDAQGKLVK